MVLTTRTYPGLIVSVLIFQQGWTFLMTALSQLTDAGVTPSTRAALLDAIQPLLPPHSSRHDHEHEHEHSHSNGHGHAHSASKDVLLAVTDLRAMRTGANMFVDLTAHVPATMIVEDAAAVEREIREALVRARRDVKEVRVRFRPVHDGEGAGERGE